MNVIYGICCVVNCDGTFRWFAVMDANGQIYSKLAQSVFHVGLVLTSLLGHSCISSGEQA